MVRSGFVRKRAAPAWVCFCTAWLLLLCGCGERMADDVKVRSQQAMRAAASDLASLGFPNASLELYEDACRVFPTIEEAMALVSRFEKAGNEGEAGACLERLFPGSREDSLNLQILDLYLRGWRWPNARLYLDDVESDTRRLKLEDILSHSRSVREPFNRPYQLNWQTRGCVTRNIRGSLLFGSSLDPWSQSEGPAMFTSLGWNGRDFRQFIDVKVLKLSGGASLVWGLAEHPDQTSAIGDTTDQFIVLEYGNGLIALRCNGPRSEDVVQTESRWFLPMNQWLRIRIEYVSGLVTGEGDNEEWAGKIRAIICERESRRQLYKLEIEPPGGFYEGRIAAGFFRPPTWEMGKSACEIYVDNFIFED